MTTTVTVLMEDRFGGNAALKTEHGLSFFIQTRGGRILFDTGATGLFMENAPLTGIDPFSADLLVLSHGHYDHSGGVIPFYRTLESRSPGSAAEIPFWCGKGFFTPKYSSTDTAGLYYYNGNPFTQQELRSLGVNILELEGSGYGSNRAAPSRTPSTASSSSTSSPSLLRQEILPGVHLVSGFNRSREGDVVTPHFVIPDPFAEGDFSRDPFDDEVSLVIETGHDGELMMIVGCSHPGIANMVASVAESFGRGPLLLLGGSHLLRADEGRMKGVISIFRDAGLNRIGLNHCTGEKTEKLLREAIPGFFSLRCGATFIYPQKGA